MKKASFSVGLIVCIGLASNCLAGNWFGRVNEPLPDKIKDFVESRMQTVGEFELVALPDTHDVYELRVMNLRYDYLISNWSQVNFANKWAREWYQEDRKFREDDSLLLVLTSSNLDQLCKAYLGDQASYTGTHKSKYFPSQRFPINFVTIQNRERLKVHRLFGGMRVLDSASCKLVVD